MKKSTILIISGAGGAGKNTVLAQLFSRFPELVSVQKWTTRARRPGEGETEFQFLTTEEFEKRINADELFDYTKFGGNYYGTPKKPVIEALAAGQTIAITFDVAGAARTKQKYPEETLWVFLTAPTDQLRRRMVVHGDNPERIRERLHIAETEELPMARSADLIVENLDGQLGQTIEKVAQAINSRLESGHILEKLGGQA